MNVRRIALLGALSAAVMATAAAQSKPRAAADRKDWIQLFNGKNLDGWVPKITGFDLGVNYNDTFHVQDGLLTVSYDKYKQFDGHFGHLFYSRQKFSYYIIAAEYRFMGEQVPGGPAWAGRRRISREGT